MAKFRKKPVVIEAFQWDGKDVHGLTTWAAEAQLEVTKRKGAGHKLEDQVMHFAVTDDPARVTLQIDTLNGRMSVPTGQWIICGVEGEFYPCTAEIFAATYEAV